MTYPEQLDTTEWKNKRGEILKRDAFKCQNCSNQKPVVEMDKGFFSGFCFPTSKEAIHIDNFGRDKFMRSGIKSEYSKYLTESAVVYSKKIPRWRRMVLAMRKLDEDEKIIFNKYAKKINQLRKSDINKLDNLVSSIVALEEKRRVEFTEVNEQKSKTTFEWLFMLGLHIHHKYYIKELRAWEYKNDALITLCQTCHEDLHRNQAVPVYDNEFELLGHYEYCKRCHGAGVFPEYSHVQKGICFRCNGARYEDLRTNINTS